MIVSTDPNNEAEKPCPSSGSSPSADLPQLMRPRWTTALALFIPLVIFLVQVGILWDYSIDDVAISYRYAQHLADGRGLTWNPGQPPVEGYSNFLWVLFLAGGSWAGFEIETFAKVSGVIIGLLTLAVLLLTCRQLWYPRRLWWTPVWLVALCPAWVIWTVSGLEIVSVSFFLTLAIYSLTAASEGKPKLLAAALAGLFFSRPEGFVLVGLILLTALIFDRRYHLSQRLSVYKIPIATVILCFIGLLVFRLSHFGYPVANTVYAKFSLALPSAGKVGSWFYFCLPFLAAYAWLMRRPESPHQRLILVTALALVFGQMILVLPVSPVMFILHRYQIAFLPLLVLAVPAALTTILSRGKPWIAITAILLVLWTLQLWPGVRASYRAETFYYRQHVCVVNKLAQLPGRPTIALLDAGRIPYWTDLPAIDAWGLCDSRIALEGFTPQAIWQAELGPPDVYIMSIDNDGFDLLPRLGFDKLVSADDFFQKEYQLWQVCPSEYYYGYAIMLRTEWARANGL